MSWNVLVYVNDVENAFKFWSYSDDNKVAWGRIGTNGTIRVFPEDVIENRVAQKLREGYRPFAQEVEFYSPPPSDVRSFWAGESQQVIIRSEPTVQSSEEVNEEISEREIERPAPEPRRRPRTRRSTSIPSYKTDSKGYIKKYRIGYMRKKIDFKVWDKNKLKMNSSMNTKAKKFYDSIPQNMITSPKRVYGHNWESDELFGRYSATTKFISFDNKIVGVYTIKRSTGVSEMFYLKTSEEKRASLVRFMVVSMVTSVGRSRVITIKTKGRTVKNILEDMFEWNYTSSRGGVDVWKIDYSTIIRLNVTQSEESEFNRFQEMNW